MGRVEHFCIGKRNLKETNKWEEFDAENFRISTNPTILFFGGNGTVKPKDANAMCEVGQSLLGIKEPTKPNEIATMQDIDLVGIAYGSDRVNFGHKKDYNVGSLTDKETNELAISIFTPLYLDERNQIRHKEQILKNFSQITFVSHCHGATEVANLICRAYSNMLDIGIEQQTVEEAFSQLYSISYAPKELIPCPGLQIIPEKDQTVRLGPDRAKTTIEFLEKRHLYHGEGTVVFKENKDTLSLIVTDMTEQQFNEHEIGFISRDEKWQILENEDVKYSDYVSKTMAVILSYAVNSSMQNKKSNHFIPRPSTDFYLQKAKAILGDSQNPDFANAIEQIQDNLSNKNRQLEREL